MKFTVQRRSLLILAVTFLFLLLGCASEQSSQGNTVKQADNRKSSYTDSTTHKRDSMNEVFTDSVKPESAEADTVTPHKTINNDRRVIHKSHPLYRYPTTQLFQVSVGTVSSSKTRNLFKDSLRIDVSLDTLKYTDIPKFNEFPSPDGSKAGFHDPYTGCYYTGSFNSYNVFNASEIYGDLVLSREYHVDSLIKAKTTKHSAKSLYPFGRYVIWLPDRSWQSGDSEFHPDSFDGIRRLKRHEIDPPDVTTFHWLLDSLIRRGYPAESPTDSIVYKEGCAGDDFGDIDYYRLRYESLSDDMKSQYDIIVKRTDSIYRIVSIVQNVRPPMRLGYEERRQWAKSMGFYSSKAEDRESLTIMGSVDLQFDGRYEVMIYRYNSGDGFHDWSYYIMGEDGKVVGRSERGSGC